MLAPNFKSAAELGLTGRQHDALIKVLGMLERGELCDGHGFSDDRPNVFAMTSWSTCLCAWANRITAAGPEFGPTFGRMGEGTSVYKLFIRTELDLADATVALRDFLCGT